MLLNLLFGIALFLFGMNLMSEHLKKITGSRMEMLLYRLTSTPLKGVLSGAGTTAIIQSSSATGAMAVGLVDSGVIGLKEGISVILGSVFGTSITGWLVAYSSLQFASEIGKYFSASYLSAVFAVIGIILKLFSHNKTLKRTGEIMLGFCILLFGIHTIGTAVEPLKNNAAFIENIARFSNPLWLFFCGVVLAAVLQSASASVGILQSISLSGAMNLMSAVSILLGIGIGASVPVILSAIGKSTRAKRAAFSYFLINSAGACVLGSLFYLFTLTFKQPFTQVQAGAVDIAALNTIYRLLLLILFTPLLGKIEQVCNLLFEKEVRKKA